MKNKLYGILLSALLVVTALCIVGCGQQAATKDADTASEAASVAANEPGSILVVYYSATGSTEAVANEISSYLDAESFAIVPEQAYTSEDLDYNDSDSRVYKEHEDAALQDVALVQTTPDGWDSYDTVILGYPIWWGEAAWPMTSFVKANDFAGKTVIPFCTSASSGAGNSAEKLAELTNDADWDACMRFASNANDVVVQEWVDGLGLQK